MAILQKREVRSGLAHGLVPILVVAVIIGIALSLPALFDEWEVVPTRETVKPGGDLVLKNWATVTAQNYKTFSLQGPSVASATDVSADHGDLRYLLKVFLPPGSYKLVSETEIDFTIGKANR